MLLSSVVQLADLTTSTGTATGGSSSGTVISLVKVINPVKKSEYVIHKLRTTTTHVFGSVGEIKELLAARLQGIPSIVDQVGYIEPGHGAKGKQRWLSDSEDIKEMYLLHRGKNEILLWCYGCIPEAVKSGTEKGANKRPDKRQRSPEPNTAKKKSRYDSDKTLATKSTKSKYSCTFCRSAGESLQHSSLI